jgi:hypothetical protein
MLPLVRDLLVQNASILVVELVDLIDVMRALCYQRAFDEVLGDVSQVVVGGELFDVLDQLGLGDSGERVLDSVKVSQIADRWSRRLTLQSRSGSSLRRWLCGGSRRGRRSLCAPSRREVSSFNDSWAVGCACGLQLIVSSDRHWKEDIHTQRP